MKHPILAAVLVLIAFGCTPIQQYAQHDKAPYFEVSSTSEGYTVIKSTSETLITYLCGGTPAYGCSYWRDPTPAKFCLIVILDDAEYKDTYAHEITHCKAGQWHK